MLHVLVAMRGKALQRSQGQAGTSSGLAGPILCACVAVGVAGLMFMSRGSLDAAGPLVEVAISGDAVSCFDCTAGGSSTTVVQGLSYSGSSFFGTTAAGIRCLGGNPSVAANVNNLGALTLDLTPGSYNAGTIKLTIRFTSPSGISVGQAQEFLGVLKGSVNSTGGGGVFVDFDNTSRRLRYHSETLVGSFMLSVNDLSIKPGKTAEITGQITGSEQSSAGYAIKGTSNTASVSGQLQIVSLTDEQLCFQVYNSSAGRICSVGMSLPGSGYSLASPNPNTSGLNFTLTPGSVSLYPAVQLDFGLISGTSFSTGPNGILAGATSQTYCILGNFTNLTAQSIAQSLYVRFVDLPTSPTLDTGRAQ